MTKQLDSRPRPCPICGDSQATTLRWMRFVLPEGHPLTDGYAVVACLTCGFVYADTAVTQQDYDVFYAKFSKYEDNQTATGGGGSPLDAARLRETAGVIAAFLNNTAARVLDLGCANGGLLGALQDLGYHALVGVDPSPSCVANTRHDYGIETHAGSLFDPLEQLGDFDCVVLSHVLEHVQDLQAAVRAVAARTRSGGVAYIEVPDAERYVEYLFAPFQDFNTEHINHFSAVSLNNLMRAGGFAHSHSGKKIIWTAPQMPYPALYGFFTKVADPIPGALSKDAELGVSIERYIADSQALLERMNQAIGEVLARSPDVVVWGTGQLTMKLLAETQLGTANIRAFVDGNPINQGKLLRQTPILSPAQLVAQNLDVPIIIGSTLHSTAIAEMIREQLGLRNEIVHL